MLIIILFFGLLIIEHFSWFEDLLVEKYPHEILISLTLFYISVGLSIYLGWGIYNLYFLPLIAVLTSGLGDAFGALIGKPYGNHIIEGRFVEGKKSLEGSVSVLVISFLVSFIGLMIIGVYPWYFNLLIGLTLGICSSLVELFTKHNLDNIVLILVNTGILMMFVVVLG
jgi:dolichol kinase